MTEKIETSSPASSDLESSIPQHDSKIKEVVFVQESDESAEPRNNNYDHSPNPFADPSVAEYYATVYEKSQYECRHVFDPTLQWSPEEERKLVRKLDWHVCLWAVCD